MKWLAMVLAMLFVAASGVAADATPEAIVKSTVEEVLTVIQKTKDRRALRELAEQKVVSQFDFREMTRLAVGPAWRDATPQQQKALEDAFRSLLVSTYTAALSRAGGTERTVEVKPAQPQQGQDDVVVKTFVKEPGRQPLEIDYRMAKRDETWKVYDVLVENLSLVTTYRSSFAEEIKRSGIDGLIKALNEKNRSGSKS
jgi:phospholipid transport system substrate-binding protein